jgi:pimeloyl-ACP methyl ester carboxylesterase
VGEGEDIVLIHGIAANHAFWHLNVLLPLARKYRVTVYDLRGHGYSGMPASGYTSADMAEDLQTLLNHLEIQKAHIIGHSFGGVVALHYANLHPDRVESIIVADTRVRALQPTNSLKDVPNWKKVKKTLKEIGLNVPKDEPELGLWLLEQLASGEWREARQKLQGRQLYIPFNSWSGGNRSAERWLNLLSSTTVRRDVTSLAGLTVEKLAKIYQPALVVYGEGSLALPSFWGLSNCLPNCKSILISGGGHFFPLTQPEYFAKTVRKFLVNLQAKERRMVKRKLINFPVELRNNASKAFAASTLNISRKGLLIESLKKLDIGCEIEIVAMPAPKCQPINLKGKIIRVAERNSARNYQFGIELLRNSSGYAAWQNFLVT